MLISHVRACLRPRIELQLTLIYHPLLSSPQQRQLMEAYIRQKRATPGMVQASDMQLVRPMSAVNRNGREVHAYDGPMQFMMSPNNPDQILTSTGNASITTTPTSPYSDGKL